MDCNREEDLDRLRAYLFQSPNPRGMDCNGVAVDGEIVLDLAFSPLILGEWIATVRTCTPDTRRSCFQSPNPRGMDCNDPDDVAVLPGPPRLSVP